MLKENKGKITQVYYRNSFLKYQGDIQMVSFELLFLNHALSFQPKAVFKFLSFQVESCYQQDTSFDSCSFFIYRIT